MPKDIWLNNESLGGNLLQRIRKSFPNMIYLFSTTSPEENVGQLDPHWTNAEVKAKKV